MWHIFQKKREEEKEEEEGEISYEKDISYECWEKRAMTYLPTQVVGVEGDGLLNCSEIVLELPFESIHKFFISETKNSKRGSWSPRTSLG